MNIGRFISETHAYDDMLVFRYIPIDANMTDDYYITYSIRTEGSNLAAQGSGLYENISVDEPVVVGIPRESTYFYEIEMLIEDVQGNLVYRSITRIGPQGQ